MREKEEREIIIAISGYVHSLVVYSTWYMQLICIPTEKSVVYSPGHYVNKEVVESILNVKGGYPCKRVCGGVHKKTKDVNTKQTIERCTRSKKRKSVNGTKPVIIDGFSARKREEA